MSCPGEKTHAVTGTFSSGEPVSRGGVEIDLDLVLEVERGLAESSTAP